MSRCTEALDRRLYPEFGDGWDNVLFRQRVLDYVTDVSVLLDVGAGAGVVEQMDFRGFVAKACGVDPDPRVLENPYLDDAKIGNAESIPYADASFDVVVSDNVLEHLDKPTKVFEEIARVLKPGGVFLFKTPNKFHYIPLIARLTPHAFHGFVNELRGRKAVDTFPTLYRANSRRQVRQLAAASGLMEVSIERIEGRPEYLRIACPLYVLGWAYERLVNRFDFLSIFRVLLVGIFSKPRD